MEQNVSEIHECAVIGINALGAEVYEVILQLPQGVVADYQAGQYSMLASKTGDLSSDSIASAPAEGSKLRLQIESTYAQPMKLLADLQSGGWARVQLPLGDVHLDLADNSPLLLIAAGTGLAQMHSIIEQARHLGSSMPIHLYWGAREVQGFYRVAAWAKWESLANVRLHRVVSHDDNWEGRSGMLYEAVIKDLSDLGNFRVVVSGSPAMVYGTLDALVEHGLQQAQVQADAFSYAPR